MRVVKEREREKERSRLSYILHDKMCSRRTLLHPHLVFFIIINIAVVVMLFFFLILLGTFG